MNTTPIRVLQVLGGLEAGGAESFVMNLYRAIDKKSPVRFCETYRT